MPLKRPQGSAAKMRRFVSGGGGSTGKHKIQRVRGQAWGEAARRYGCEGWEILGLKIRTRVRYLKTKLSKSLHCVKSRRE